jgi:hypothetical protein
MFFAKGQRHIIKNKISMSEITDVLLNRKY